MVDESKLRALYDEYKDDDEAVELITEHMPNRNEKSIRAKLNKMGLSIKDPTKWTEEVNSLRCISHLALILFV